MRYGSVPNKDQADSRLDVDSITVSSAPPESRIVCGRWSTLGLFAGLGIYAIDTSAIWSGQLTAMNWM